MPEANILPLPFDKYTLLAEIGRGGFGIVYRAVDSTLDREVAVKVLHPQLAAADSDFIKRFRNEAKSVARLRHPNLVGVYEIGELEGRWYIAMEYMPGGSLADRLRERGAIPFVETLAVIKEVCAGLEPLHAAGMVHRDVKPGNILFSGDGQAVLGDFGLVRSALFTSGPDTSGGRAGTPYYKAPELWRGKPPASPATDVYAMGCVFYEMLTGRVLFGGETPDEVITRHLVDGPEFGPEWLPSGVPVGVDEVVRKALAKRPEDRYSTAGEMAKDVEGLLGERDVSQARPQTTRPSTAMSAGMNGGEAKGIATLTLSLIQEEVSSLTPKPSFETVDEKARFEWRSFLESKLVLWGLFACLGVVLMLIIAKSIPGIWAELPIASATSIPSIPAKTTAATISDNSPTVTIPPQVGTAFSPSATIDSVAGKYKDWTILTSFPSPAAKPTDIVRSDGSLWITIQNEYQAYGINLKGDIIVEYTFSHSIVCNQVTWDGSSLWFGCNETIRQVNATTGGELGVIDMDVNESIKMIPAELLWGDDAIWLIGREAVYIWNPVSKLKEGQFEVDVDLLNLRGAAWDGEALWLLDADSNLARYDRDGRRLRRLAVSIAGWPEAMIWGAGELWVLDMSGTVTRFNKDAEMVGSFDLDQCGYEIGEDVIFYWDGEHLWLVNRS